MNTFTTQSERAAMVPDSVRKVMDRLRARVAGGAVRDSLVGVVPKDWDLATPLTPDEVMYVAKAMGFNVLPTGLQHGTVTVMVDGDALEVTTLRVDVETDGRHAEVEFTTDWKVDASRRDLTMNAMYMDLDGEVHDFFNGQEDLAAGVVRFVGNASERLQEDYLRVLRFFRFVGRMGATRFDPDAMRAVRRNANGLTRVSGERVWMEMEKILTGKNLKEVLESMRTHGVLSVVGVTNPNVDAAVHANSMGARAETVLAALVETTAAAEEVADAWKLSNKERTTLMFVVNNSDSLHHMDHTSMLDWKKVAVTHGKELTAQLMRMTPNREMVAEMESLVLPVFPVTGQHLLSVGVEAGPEMGRKLKALKQVWMDADFEFSLRKLLQMVGTV